MLINAVPVSAFTCAQHVNAETGTVLLNADRQRRH